MKFLPNDTLAFFEAMPQKHPLNLSSRPSAKWAAATKAYRENCGKVSPDIRAVEFYATNHFYSCLQSRFSRNEQLPSWALKLAHAYSSTLVEQSERMMHYVVSIITREARHFKSMSDTLKANLLKLYGQPAVDLMAALDSLNEDGAVQHYMDGSSSLAIGPYIRTLEMGFDKGVWDSQFGGKPWGKIARTLGDMAYGLTSLEVMVDTAYTLAHNNGPIFNKGMMYTGYSTKFKIYLDVQRSGQIPEMIRNRANESLMSGFSAPGLFELTDLAYEHMPEEFGQYVDWHKVEKLGALGNYFSYKAEQDQAHPPKAKPVLFAGQPAVAAGTIKIYPGQELKICKRVEQEA